MPRLDCPSVSAESLARQSDDLTTKDLLQAQPRCNMQASALAGLTMLMRMLVTATYPITYQGPSAMRRFGVLGLRGPEPGVAEASSAPKSLKVSLS